MISLKWKIYRIINYVLLISGAFIFLRFIELATVNPYHLSIVDYYRMMNILVSLIFLLMAVQSIINLVIMAKNFPDKILTGAKNRWHTLATILNGISLSFMIYGCFGVSFEMADDPDEDGLLILLLIFIALFLSTLFVFICQVTLKRYLQRNSTNLANSMIDSIGTDV